MIAGVDRPGNSKRAPIGWAPARWSGAAMLAVFLAQPAAAQGENPWSIYESIQGSFNSAGQIFKINTSVAYKLTEYLEAGAGLPVYLVRASDSSHPLGDGWNTGLGNAFVNLRLSTSRNAWYFASGLTAAAPTGDRERGFSTGKVTVDWNNSAAFYLPRATVFASAGVANTVSDTSFFVRPFSSTGLVGHFDGGLLLLLRQRLGVGVLGYAIRGGGEQQVVSRVVQRDGPPGPDQRRGFETTVETRGQDLADDHGFSTWLDITAGQDASVQVGYTRSVPYAYDTAFFSIGFDIISLVR